MCAGHLSVIHASDLAIFSFSRAVQNRVNNIKMEIMSPRLLSKLIQSDIKARDKKRTETICVIMNEIASIEINIYKNRSSYNSNCANHCEFAGTKQFNFHHHYVTAYKITLDSAHHIILHLQTVNYEHNLMKPQDTKSRS